MAELPLITIEVIGELDALFLRVQPQNSPRPRTRKLEPPSIEKESVVVMLLLFGFLTKNSEIFPTAEGGNVRFEVPTLPT